MAYIDKKNTWSFLKCSSDCVEQKMIQIVSHLKHTYPNIEYFKGTTAKFSISGVDVWVSLFQVRRKNSAGYRTTLRMSIKQEIIDKKTLHGNERFACEIAESYPYADGTSRIDLATLVEEIKKIAKIEYDRRESEKTNEFKQQLEQMKLVGRIQTCIKSEAYKVVKNDHWRKQVDIKNQKNERVGVVEYNKTNARPFAVRINGAWFYLREDQIDSFIKDAEGIFKYANEK
jgi:hypothetical protein